MEAGWGLPGHTIQTQKGSAAIATTSSSELVYLNTDDHTCSSVTPLNGGWQYEFTLIVLCDIAGVYPADIRPAG